MTCPRCNGLVVDGLDSPYCLNCGNRPTLRYEAEREDARERSTLLCWYCRRHLRMPRRKICEPCMERDRQIREREGIRCGRGILLESVDSSGGQ